MRNRTFDSRGRSDNPNVSDAKIRGGGQLHGWGALTVFYSICISSSMSSDRLRLPAPLAL